MAKSSKKPKATKEAAAQDEAPKGGGKVTHLVPAATLNSLLKSRRSMKESVDDLTTDFASQVMAAVDKKNLHKGAFRTICTLDRMTPEKLADWLEHFDHMLEVSGLEKRASSAPRFEGVGGPDDDLSEKGDGFQDDKTGDAGSNVTGFPTPVH